MDDNDDVVVLSVPLSIHNTQVSKINHDGGVRITHRMGHEYEETNLTLDARIIVDLQEFHKPKEYSVFEKTLGTIMAVSMVFGLIGIGIGIGFWIKG